LNQKGIDLLLKAYKIAAQKIKAPLILAGNGKDKAKIEKYRQKLGLKNRVFLVGKVQGQKKEELLSKAKVVCIPSRYETGSVVATECLLLKKVMAAFDIPSLKEITQNQAIFAKPFDVDDLADKMIYAFKNAEKISQSIKFKPLPSWDEIVQEQEKFYLKIVKGL
jgi:glycosyltransferase involved in cell wall biosynthesis